MKKQLCEIIHYGTIRQLKEFLADKPIDILSGFNGLKYLLLAAIQISIQTKYGGTSALQILLFLLDYEEIIMSGCAFDSGKIDIETPYQLYCRITQIVIQVACKYVNLSAYQISLFKNLFNKIFESKWIDSGKIYEGGLYDVVSIKNIELMELIIASNEFKKGISRNSMKEIMYDGKPRKNHIAFYTIIYKHYPELCHTKPHAVYYLYIHTSLVDKYVNSLDIESILQTIYCKIKRAMRSRTICKIYYLLKSKEFDFNEIIPDCDGNSIVFLSLIIKKFEHDYSELTNEKIIELESIITELISASTIEVLNLAVDDVITWPILSKFINMGVKTTSKSKITQINNISKYVPNTACYLNSNDIINYANSEKIFIINMKNIQLIQIIWYKLYLINNLLNETTGVYWALWRGQVHNDRQKEILNIFISTRDLLSSCDRGIALNEILAREYYRPEPTNGPTKYNKKYNHLISQLYTYEIAYILNQSIQPEKNWLLDSFKLIVSEDIFNYFKKINQSLMWFNHPEKLTHYNVTLDTTLINDYFEMFNMLQNAS